MYNGIEFLSVFKIGEKPILRPCLSDSKREEIRRFKAKALEIERRNAEKTKSTISYTGEEEIQENMETFLGDFENCSAHSENHTDNDGDNDNFVTSISEWDISSIPGADIQDGTVSLCSGATEVLEYVENTNDTAGQSNDTIVNAPLPSSIIRSDSFIVDEPSECFLKQLEDNGVVVPSNTTSLTDVSVKTDVNQTKILVKPATVTKRKPEVKKATTPKLKKYQPKPFGFRKGRVTSDNISNLPEKLIRKCQSNTVNVSDIRKERQEKSMPKQGSSNQTCKSISQVESIYTQTEMNRESSNESINDRTAEIISDIEEKFHNEIALFLEKQKREQDAFLRKLMTQVKAKQDAFQCSLVMQIKAMIDDGVSKFLQNQAVFASLSNNTNTLNDKNGNLSHGGNDGGQHEISKAATKINAFIRGCLTRRLFKTEYVQQVIKTIRDSLYLVIDLHFEKTNVESVADIQMKHNLLQQLESNRYTLSNIFTTKTIAERMAMIAFDRQMIAKRLVQSKAKNNNIYDGPLKVNQSPNATNERPNSMNDRQNSINERPNFMNEHPSSMNENSSPMNEHPSSMNERRIAMNKHLSSMNERLNVMNERSSSMNVEDKLKKLKIVVLFHDSIDGKDAMANAN